MNKAVSGAQPIFAYSRCHLLAYLLSYLETGSLELLLPRLDLPSSESLSAVLAAVSPLLSGLLELSTPLSSAAPAMRRARRLQVLLAVTGGVVSMAL